MANSNNRKIEKMVNIARGTMFALHQFGVEYEVNVIGWGPSVTVGPKPEDHSYELYDSPVVMEYLSAETKDGRQLAAPAAKSAIVCEDGSGYLVQLTRIIWPTEQDLDDYAAWCGCDSFDEAQAMYGDIPCSRANINIFVPEGKIARFISKVVKYCWE